MQAPANTMQDWLSARVKTSPDKAFLYSDISDHAITFAQLDQQVNVMCAKWQAVGIQAKQHIGLLMINFPLTVVQTLSAIRYGVTLIPLNLRLTVEEMDFQLKQSHADWLLPYGTTDLLRALQNLGHHIAPLDTIRKVKSKKISDTEIQLDEPFAIIHTSGTSGKPKGAVLTYSNIFYSAMASAYHTGILPDDRWLCVLPLYHVGGLSIILRSILYGTAVDLMEKFDVEAVNHKLTHEPITLVSLVPTMLQRLLDARKEVWNPKLRLVLLGGAAPSAELVGRCVEEGIPLATTYGLTEAASQVATATPQQVIKKPASVGKALIFNSVRIVNDYGKDCSPDEIGEIVVQGLSIMQGYYKNDDANMKSFKDGWFHTGDMGYKDKDGDLFVVQRRSDLIVTGGENVYPAEVEAVLRQHPQIIEAVILGLNDSEWGQTVAAAIQLEANSNLSPDKIIEFARQHLAGYKIPRKIIFVDEFPQTGSGKIQRSEVRKLFSS